MTFHDNNYYYDIIRINIKKIRIERKLTQEQLAELVDYSVEYITEIESLKKHKTFSIVLVGRIADVTNKDIRWFFCKHDEEVKINNEYKWFKK